jgi:hypothetical protein
MLAWAILNGHFQTPSSNWLVLKSFSASISLNRFNPLIPSLLIGNGKVRLSL